MKCWMRLNTWCDDFLKLHRGSEDDSGSGNKKKLSVWDLDLVEGIKLQSLHDAPTFNPKMAASNQCER